MKTVIQASEIHSTLTHMPGNRGRAIFKTLDSGQYAVSAKSIVMENTKTGEKINLGESKPVSSKELFEYQMLLPKERLMNTFPGIVGEFFAQRGTWGDKKDWNVIITEAAKEK